MKVTKIGETIGTIITDFLRTLFTNSAGNAEGADSAPVSIASTELLDNNNRIKVRSFGGGKTLG